MAVPKRGDLAGNRAFQRLWWGQSFSMLGQEVTFIALPLTAALFLHVRAWQMGLMMAVANLPYLLLTVPAGVYVERVQKRPVLAAADGVRLLLTLAVPVLFWLRLLSFSLLAADAFLLTAATVVFDVAYQPYLPEIVARDDILAANGRLQLSSRIATVLGQSAGGAAIQGLSAPVSFLINAATYAVSAASLLTIKRRTTAPRAEITRTSPWHLAAEGLRFVWETRLLRLMISVSAVLNLTASGFLAVWFLFMVHDLHFTALMVGAVMALGGVGGIVGALLARSLVRRNGYGRTVLWGETSCAAGLVLIAVAGGTVWTTRIDVVVALALFMAGLSTWNIVAVSLRIAVTPSRLLARVTASSRVLSWGASPIGSLAAGLLGTLVGLRSTIAILAAVLVLATGWLAAAGPRRQIARTTTIAPPSEDRSSETPA